MTEWLAWKRHAGKTTQLIRRAANANGYIVARDTSRVELIQRMARDLDVDIRAPMTFREFIEGSFYPPGCSPIWIDDVDELLRYLARGCEIGAVTRTKE